MKKTKSLSASQIIKLHTSSNPWKPHSLDSDLSSDENLSSQEIFRKVRAILNKLTPQKFDILVRQIKSIEIDTEEKLKGIVDLIFEKAIVEPKYSLLYATTCKHLASIKVFNYHGGYINFKKCLLEKCQENFEQNKNVEKLKPIENISDTRRLREKLQEKEWKNKQKQLGNVRFIGDLFNLGVFSEAVIKEYILKLFYRNDENSFEFLCQLFKCIGKSLEAQKEELNQEEQNVKKIAMDEYISSIQNIVNTYQISPRIRFLLLDIIELRENSWEPRRKEDIPRTIDEIHEEFLKEETMLQELSKSSKKRPRKKRNKDTRPKET